MNEIDTPWPKINPRSVHLAFGSLFSSDGGVIAQAAKDSLVPEGELAQQSDHVLFTFIPQKTSLAVAVLSGINMTRRSVMLVLLVFSNL